MPRKIEVVHHLEQMLRLFPNMTYVQIFEENEYVSGEGIARLREQYNEEMLEAWLEYHAEDNITFCPISPVHQADVYTHRPFTVDGSRIVDETGFVYEYAEFRAEDLRECIDEFRLIGCWPMRDE